MTLKGAAVTRWGERKVRSSTTAASECHTEELGRSLETGFRDWQTTIGSGSAPLALGMSGKCTALDVSVAATVMPAALLRASQVSSASTRPCIECVLQIVTTILLRWP